jgi:hypothetical protein
MIDAVEELVMSLGPSTMAGLMTTMSSSLSLAKAQAAFSVMVFATGPHSWSEDSTTTHDLQHNQVWKNSQFLPSQSSSSWHRTSKDSIGRTSSRTSSSSWIGNAGDGAEERERETHTHTHTLGEMGSCCSGEQAHLFCATEVQIAPTLLVYTTIISPFSAGIPLLIPHHGWQWWGEYQALDCSVGTSFHHVQRSSHFQVYHLGLQLQIHTRERQITHEQLSDPALLDLQ